MTDSSRVPQTHRIILVRHAQSRVDETRNPREWGLTEAGHAAARRLAALALFDHAAGFYAGDEPKMLETLAPVAAAHGQRVQAETDLGETHSEGWLGSDEFYATVRRFFQAPDQPPAPGWETAANAVARFSAGIARLSERHQPVLHPGHALPGTVAVASGGRMLISYLAHTLGYAPEQAHAVWRDLRMPDLAVLELSTTAPPRLNERYRGRRTAASWWQCRSRDSVRLVIPFGTLTV
jgi:broad specificity phosphatase PhoE